jgi:hypothetical protein
MPPKDEFLDGLRHAEQIALKERDEAQQEVDYAGKPGSKFKTANKDVTQKRLETATKIARAISRAIRDGFPPP